MKKLAILILLCVSVTICDATFAENVVVGVNIWNEGLIPKTAWDAELRQMAQSGVKTIRTSLNPTTTDFVIAAYQHGIGSVVIVYPFLGSKAKPKGGWGRYALSQLDAREFTAAFEPLLDKLEGRGVRLAAFELGNEINATGFNGDLDDPGSGRELSLSDLNNPNDPEGAIVAAGYRNYIRIMAALKDLRDHSRLNQHTPIISAGLAQKLGTKQVEVNLHDTIAFFHQNGMDKLADGYGIHVYLSADPNRPVSARIASFEQDVFSACRQAGKPCWVTEWGFGNSDESCPPNDKLRIKLMQDMHTVFEHFASQGQLGGAIYYDWTIKPGKPDSWAILRCGSLTDAGKLALSPMQ